MVHAAGPVKREPRGRRMIVWENVSKTWDGGRSWAVRDLDLEVREGELVALLGESGCGKTTTLKMVNRLVEPTSGRVCIGGGPVEGRRPSELRRGIGYVIQEVGLFPHLTVGENVSVVPRLLGWPPSRIAERVDELLSLVGLDPTALRDRWPATLSGGQQQRVGVARALAARPRVMLMDEPFGAVDPITRDTLQREYLAIHRRLGLTTLLVTHDVVEALILADRLAIMADGRLVAADTPARLLDASDPRVRHLMTAPRRQAEAVGRLLPRGADA